MAHLRFCSWCRRHRCHRLRCSESFACGIVYTDQDRKSASQHGGKKRCRVYSTYSDDDTLSLRVISLALAAVLRPLISGRGCRARCVSLTAAYHQARRVRVTTTGAVPSGGKRREGTAVSAAEERPTAACAAQAAVSIGRGPSRGVWCAGTHGGCVEAKRPVGMVAAAAALRCVVGAVGHGRVRLPVAVVVGVSGRCACPCLARICLRDWSLGSRVFVTSNRYTVSDEEQ